MWLCNFASHISHERWQNWTRKNLLIAKCTLLFKILAFRFKHLRVNEKHVQWFFNDYFFMYIWIFYYIITVIICEIYDFEGLDLKWFRISVQSLSRLYFLSDLFRIRILNIIFLKILAIDIHFFFIFNFKKRTAFSKFFGCSIFELKSVC